MNAYPEIVQRAGTVQKELSVAVVIATLGRPALVNQMMDLMASQTSKPDILLFSVVSDDDIPADFRETDAAKVIKGRKGLCAQRNAALEYLGKACDIIVFYDDDFIPARNSIENIRAFFLEHPEVAGATGNVIADGINAAGITFDEAKTLLARHDLKDFTPNCIVTSLVGLYGCNMAYRSAAIGETRFDERLRLYAWQEDIDFASSLRSRGRIVKTLAFAGVHQGIKSGRTSGIRLGYSQIINPAYLARKGTMPVGFAAKLILRNFLANHLKALRPEPWVDRRGRAKGNWIGLFDLVCGRLTPERIEEL